MAQDEKSIPAMKKTKTKLQECDIKPLIYALSGEGAHADATLVLTEREACKPGMLMEALTREAGITGDVRYLITRLALYGKDGNGALVPLERL